jgi:hypothetical protein
MGYTTQSSMFLPLQKAPSGVSGGRHSKPTESSLFRIGAITVAVCNLSTSKDCCNDDAVSK